jgi:hypothetical protein
MQNMLEKSFDSLSFANSCTTTTSFCKGEPVINSAGSPLLVLIPLALFEEKKGKVKTIGVNQAGYNNPALSSIPLRVFIY